MQKILLFLSFVGLLLLGIGTAVAPDSPAFWLASGAATFQRAREVLLVILFAQLITKPPRHMTFRILAGFVAVAVGVWVWNETYNYRMPFLDTLCFTGAAIAIAVAALERRTAGLAQRTQIIVTSD